MEAFQASATAVGVTEVVRRFVGVVGGEVSEVNAVLTERAVLAGERLPEGSTAFTVKLYSVLATSPVTLKMVLAVVPTCVAPLKI